MNNEDRVFAPKAGDVWYPRTVRKTGNVGISAFQIPQKIRAPSEIGFTPLAVAVAKERLAHDFRQIQLKQRNIIEFMILTGGRRP